MRGIFKFVKVMPVILAIGLMTGGCSGGDDGSPSADHRWSTYYSKYAVSLPACTANIVGRLYYVEDQANFQVCKSTGWSIINVGNAVSTIDNCSKISNGLLFEYTTTNFTNGDKFITCQIIDGSIGLLGSYYWKRNLNGAENESCFVNFDIDSSSAGWWRFAKTSGVRRVTYNDPNSTENNATVTFSTSDCSVSQ